MAVIWTAKARDDLADIFAYIARDNRSAAERWVGRLIERAELSALTPLAGRVVPELRRSNIREAFLKSYRIIYRVDGDDIHVVTVFEGHRRLQKHEIDEV